MRERVVMAVVVLTFAGCGCETVSAGDVKTSGLYARLEADAPGDGKLAVKATLSLGQGSLTFLQLGTGEELVAKLGQASKSMTRRSVLGQTWYEASFDGDAADTPLRISLTRTTEDSAPESSVTLPPPFEVSGPAPAQAFPRATPVTLSWTNTSADPLRIAARGACIQTVEKTAPGDVGSFTLPAFQSSTGNETQSCDVQVTVVRVRTGRVDPAYGKGGLFEATATRSITLRSTP